jgi:hypothetical protein
MPIENQTTERAIELRKMILAACSDSPKSIQQIGEITGRSIESLRYNITKIMPRYLKRTEGISATGNKLFFYEPTKHEYLPDLTDDAEEKVESQFTKDGENPDWLTVVKCRHNASVAVHRSAWTGTTLGSMTF